MKERDKNLIIGVILVLALSVRIYVSFFSVLQRHAWDTSSYFNFADSLKNAEYREPFLPPGYSLLVLILDHFGNRDLTMIIFNIVISVLACLLVYFICFKITASQKMGLSAMGIMAVYPNNVNYVRYILSDTPAMFFLVASVFLILYYKDKLPGAFLSALALGVAGIIRVTCLPVIFFYALVYLCQKKFARLCGYLIFFLVPVIIVLGINYYHTKRLFISNNLAINFIISAESRSGNIYYDGARNPRYQKIIDNNDARGAWLVYLNSLKDNPREWVIKRFLSAWELWGPYPASEGRRSVLIRLLIGLRFILLMLAVAGGYFLARRSRTQFLILSGPIITITLVHFLLFSVPRYTHVIEPLAICLALCVFPVRSNLLDAKTNN